MSIIEGPDRGQRLHVSISTHRQRRQGGARHALPTRRICRNRRGRIKRAAKFGRRRARVNQFEYFFRCRHGNGYLPPWASHTMFAILLRARLNKHFHTKQRIFIAHNLSMQKLYESSRIFSLTLYLHITFRWSLSKLRRILLITFVQESTCKKLQFNYVKMSPLIIFFSRIQCIRISSSWSPHGLSCYQHLTFLSSRNI